MILFVRFFLEDGSVHLCQIFSGRDVKKTNKLGFSCQTLQPCQTQRGAGKMQFPTKADNCADLFDCIAHFFVFNLVNSSSLAHIWHNCSISSSAVLLCTERWLQSHNPPWKGQGNNHVPSPHAGTATMTSSPSQLGQPTLTSSSAATVGCAMMGTTWP